MKVLQVGINREIGGIETFLLNIMSKFDRSSVEVDFIKYSNVVAFEDKLCALGCSFHKLVGRSQNPLLFYISLIKFFFQHKEYTIVHNHLNSASCIGATVIAKLFGRTTITHSHNEYLGGRLITRILIFINKPILNWCTDVRLACSEKAGKSMFGKRSFEIITNGIDIEKYTFKSDVRVNVRNEFGFSDEIRIIGHVGGFKHQKNHEFLVDLFSVLYQKDKRYRLLLVGDGVLKPKIEDKVNALNLTNVVVFAGQRFDADRLLNAMDVFILPSFFEGLPFVAIEAQASGIPLLISDVVSKEVDLTPTVYFLPLSEGVECWVSKLESIDLKLRSTVNVEHLREKGYDCKATTDRLRTIYVDLLKAGA